MSWMDTYERANTPVGFTQREFCSCCCGCELCSPPRVSAGSAWSRLVGGVL